MPTPRLVTARLIAQTGDLGVLAARQDDGTDLRVVVRVAGYSWHNLTAAGNDAVWEQVRAIQNWRILEIGSTEQLPLAEPWIDGVPLGVAMRSRGWITGGRLGYPLTLATDPLPPTPLEQFSSWVDGMVVIVVALGALILLSMRDRSVLEAEKAAGVKVSWWKRPGRWLLGPGFAKPITPTTHVPPSEPRP